MAGGASNYYSTERGIHRDGASTEESPTDFSTPAVSERGSTNDAFVDELVNDMVTLPDDLEEKGRKPKKEFDKQNDGGDD